MPSLAIFTDFDGTLVEIAETPDAIEVPDELPVELGHLIRCFDGAVAIISGRSLDDLDHHLPITIAAAGAHGAERRRADGTRLAADAGLVLATDRIAGRLQALAESHPELIVERKPGAVALHYRRSPDLAEACNSAMQTAVADAEGFEILEGKMVVEARRKGASKADMVRAFMQEPPFLGRVPVFFGDDRTDEDGFRAAQELGGVGVKVGDGETTASVRAADVTAARAIMVGLAERALADGEQTS